ncbi:MAG TPA: hypothetical protein VFZ48_00600 [Candidatus Saccharimonadales bacterium]
MTPEENAFADMLAQKKLPLPRWDTEKNLLKRMGVRLVDDGEVIGLAQLPPGWRVEGIKFSTSGRLFDKKGRLRGTFFYKDNEYETTRSWHFNTRYSTRDRGEGSGDWCVVDTVTGKVLFEDTDPPGEAKYEAAKAWLQKNYPDWQDPAKYWN